MSRTGLPGNGLPSKESPVTLLVGTRKGLFRIESDASRNQWRLEGPFLAGNEILHVAQLSGNPARLLAATNHPIWGAHLFASEDGGRDWQPLEAAPHFPAGSGATGLKAIWFLAPEPEGDGVYAGIDPAGLFYSPDAGLSWASVNGLNEHSTRARWEPARGGFSVHSIRIDPRDKRRMVVAVSAGGVFRSEDGGRVWTPANRGVRAENLPGKYPELGHNVHRVILAPSDPERLYRQCYNGTYRSDDFALTWNEITTGLPSDFGYALAVAPACADTLFQVPESGSHMRAVVDGSLRVFKSRDGGASWCSASQGLPQEHAYVSVLREAMDTDSCAPCGVYFGTTSGHVFASADAADHWQLVSSFLPRVLCVKALDSRLLESHR
ncbi:MAG: hypothetical protein OQK99_10770 [Gammaproteobacteria bacterium]|jgi:photosystem II stability/assembly factor-like uncharacterized protein|nr:hypothetical protein [Gammaproteobacteria bacterium]